MDKPPNENPNPSGDQNLNTLQHSYIQQASRVLVHGNRVVHKQPSLQLTLLSQRRNVVTANTHAREARWHVALAGDGLVHANEVLRAVIRALDTLQRAGVDVRKQLIRIYVTRPCAVLCVVAP